jgi:hypothetical protein
LKLKETAFDGYLYIQPSSGSDDAENRLLVAELEGDEWAEGVLE